MGEDVVELGQFKPLPGHLAQLNWDSFSGYIARTYAISDEPGILLLEELLDGIAMRDKRSSGPQYLDAETQRLAVHKAAKAIVCRARAVRNELNALQEALSEFDTAVRRESWSAVMLEEAFDIPFVPSNAIEPPELFDQIRGFFLAQPESWKKIRSSLHDLSSLPVRSKLRTNKVRDHALDQGLTVCRDFWVNELNRSWTRSTLADSGAVVCDKCEPEIDRPHLQCKACLNRTANLQGDCERFVVDMLTASGLDFNLKTLNGAWSAFEKRLRKEANRAIHKI